MRRRAIWISHLQDLHSRCTIRHTRIKEGHTYLEDVPFFIQYGILALSLVMG